MTIAVNYVTLRFAKICNVRNNNVLTNNYIKLHVIINITHDIKTLQTMDKILETINIKFWKSKLGPEIECSMDINKI